ncbi:hypothetical protein PRIPAC_93757, partial [Pristionchus pacificus]
FISLMYRHTDGSPFLTRSSTTITTTRYRNGFPRDEEEIYHDNYRLAIERERAGKDNQPPETSRDNGEMSRKGIVNGVVGDTIDGSSKGKGMDDSSKGRQMDDMTGSPPKRLLKWPRPPLSTQVYTESSVTVQSETKIEQKIEMSEISERPPSSRTATISKRNTGKCEPPLVARSIDPYSIQVYRSSERTPLLLRLSTKRQAEQTRFLPSPYQDAPIEKVHLLREEEDLYAFPFIPQSVVSSTLVPLYLTASEQRRALVHPIKTREIRSIRLIVLPPLHTITIRTNECGGEFLTVHSLLSPHDPYRARRLRPIWETLIPLHATGHHVAVPFTLTLTAPFTVHRIVTRVQKLQVVDARTLYRHSPVFCIESSRAMNRESARLTTVEKEDPQMVRLMHMDQLFPTRMTTRTTVKVKRTEVFQGDSTYHDSPSNHLQMDKSRLKNLSAIKPIDTSVNPSQMNQSNRLAPIQQSSGRHPVYNGDTHDKSLVTQLNPTGSMRQEVISNQPKMQSLSSSLSNLPRESERRKTKKEPDYNIFIRDVNAHKETKGASHINDYPAVKESHASNRHTLPPSTRIALSPPPQEVTPPTIEKRPFNDFSIPSRPLPTRESLQGAPLKQKSQQSSMPPPLRPSSAETTSAEVIDPPKRPRTVLPPPPPHVPMAPKSAEMFSQEPLAQPKKKTITHAPPPPKAGLFQRDKKTVPPSQPSSGPLSAPVSDPMESIEPPRRGPKIVAKPSSSVTSMSSTMTTTTPNATSATPAPASSQPLSPPPGRVGYINIIQPSMDAPKPKPVPPPLPVADGTQKSSSSGKNKFKPPSEGSDSGGKKHKMVNNAVIKKDRPKVGSHKKKSGSNKKSKFGPRGHEQMEELGNVRLVADAVKAGEIEADPNAQDAITHLIKKATTPLGGKKKKKKKSSK